jgi:hypothetical protein
MVVEDRPVHRPVTAVVVPPGWKSDLPRSDDDDVERTALVKTRWQIVRAVRLSEAFQSMLDSAIPKMSISWSNRNLQAC